MTSEVEKRDFIESFTDAERSLKAYERESSETLEPCINELRYSAYHVAQALKAELNGESADFHWQRAIRHTRRAKFDVLEFRVALCMEQVNKIAESYKGYEFLAGSIIPNYFRHSKALFSVSSELERLHELDKESSEYVKMCEKHIRVARDFIRDFHAAEEVLFSEIANREMEKEQSVKDKKRDKGISWVQVIISALLGALLGHFVG